MNTYDNARSLMNWRVGCFGCCCSVPPPMQARPGPPEAPATIRPPGNALRIPGLGCAGAMRILALLVLREGKAGGSEREGGRGRAFPKERRASRARCRMHRRPRADGRGWRGAPEPASAPLVRTDRRARKDRRGACASACVPPPSIRATCPTARPPARRSWARRISSAGEGGSAPAGPAVRLRARASFCERASFLCVLALGGVWWWGASDGYLV